MSTRVVTRTTEARTDPRTRAEVVEGYIAQGWKLDSFLVTANSNYLFHPDMEGVALIITDSPKE